MQPTVDDVRALARRSRKTHRWGMLAVTGALLFVPAQLALAPWVSQAWLGLAAVLLGGLLLLRFAFVAGAERGAYRLLFRDLKAARSVGVEESRKEPPKVVGP